MVAHLGHARRYEAELAGVAQDAAAGATPGPFRGRDAARFAFASFFLLLSLNVIIAQAQGAAGYAPADMIAAAAAWFVALVTVALIFVPASNRYFRQMAAPVAHPAG